MSGWPGGGGGEVRIYCMGFFSSLSSFFDAGMLMCGLRQLTTGRNTSAGLTFFWPSVIYK